MRALVAAVVLLGASTGAFAQTLACNPKLPRPDPGAGFSAFGATEQALARGGNSGPAWEWALGTDTDGASSVHGSADWTSGKSFTWSLTYSGTGSATLVVSDGSSTVLNVTYPSGMDAGNALQLQAALNSSIGSDTTIAANVSSIAGKAASGALSLSGTKSASSQALYFYYPPMSQGFTAQGNVTLSYASLPTGSRVDFTVKAGTLPCTNQAPSVSLAAPPAGAIVQAGSASTLSANAVDADGTVAKVEFFANGISIGATTAAPYSMQWTPQPGSYTLTAVATDNAGDETTSTQVAVVANAQPTVSITSPASGTILQPPGALTLAATAADSDGTVSKVDFYQGATLLGTASTAPYSFSIPALPAGTYSFTAVAADDRGGSTTSAPVSVVVNAPPTVTLTSPTANATFKAPASIALAATAADIDGTIASVAFYNGDTLITTLTAAPYSFTWTGVPQGTYTLTARVTDNTGDTISSDPITITVTPALAQLYFIEVDHLNTPRLVANAAGTTVWKWDQQEPFGDNVADGNPSGLGPFDLPLRLPGQYFDEETNSAYNWYRDYDPANGRYVESDLIGLSAGLNNYAYVRSNPVRLTDRLGLKTCGSGWNDPIVPDNPGFPFSDCCKQHDDCYGDCVNRPSRGRCDNDFLKCALQKCNGRWMGTKYACEFLAVTYYEFVYTWGAGPFNEARSKCNASACKLIK
jgi:RHS repeat-associated protein